MSSSSSARPLRWAALVALCLLFVPGAAAQLTAELELAAGMPSGPAMPEGTPATINVTITYQCGGLDGDATITATSDTAGVTATVTPPSFTAEAPVTGCDLNSPATPVTATVTVNMPPDVLVGTGVAVTINVTGANLADQPQYGNLTTEVTAGPYIDVTFEPTAERHQVPAGETVKVFVRILSQSNVMVMGMPSFKTLPDGWKQPSAFPVNVESPLVEGENGTSAFEFDVLVPRDATVGEHTVELEVYAHTMGEIGPTLNTETVTIPLVFDVTPGAATDDDAEESPAPVLLPLVLAVALLAWARRRA